MVLAHDRAAIASALVDHGTMYVITNSRSLPEDAAVSLYRSLAAEIAAVGRSLGRAVSVVLRGDSTLRGHVFAESAVFEEPGSLLVLCPAFPSGGRRTVGGVHEVRIGGRWVNAADTEFARDPVFGFRERDLRSYVIERSGRPVVVADATTLEAVATTARPGTVVVLDASTDDDLMTIARVLRDLAHRGVPCVVRCAAPLAAYLGGVKSVRPVAAPVVDGPLLVVAGSHTAAATAQLEDLARRYGDPVVLDTEPALADPEAAAAPVARALLDRFDSQQVAVLATDRTRRSAHATLDHGARVMAALGAAVHHVAPAVHGIVAKGGITSFAVARHSLGLRTAWVEGQLLAGVSLWRAEVAGRPIPYVVVPGNVGAADTMTRLVRALDGSLTRVDAETGEEQGETAGGR